MAENHSIYAGRLDKKEICNKAGECRAVDGCALSIPHTPMPVCKHPCPMFYDAKCIPVEKGEGDV